MNYKSEVLDGITALENYFSILPDNTIVSGIGINLNPLNDGSAFAGMYTIQKHINGFGTIMIMTNGLIFTNFHSNGIPSNWQSYVKNSEFALDNLSGMRFGFRADGIYIIFFLSSSEYYQLNFVQAGLVFEKYINGQSTIIWSK